MTDWLIDWWIIKNSSCLVPVNHFIDSSTSVDAADCRAAVGNCHLLRLVRLSQVTVVNAVILMLWVSAKNKQCDDILWLSGARLLLKHCSCSWWRCQSQLLRGPTCLPRPSAGRSNWKSFFSKKLWQMFKIFLSSHFVVAKHLALVFREYKAVSWESFVTACTWIMQDFSLAAVCPGTEFLDPYANQAKRLLACSCRCSGVAEKLRLW